MTGIPLIQAQMGFMPANRRPACRNCVHVREQVRAQGDNLTSWHCNRGGFPVTVQAVCDEHQPTPAYVQSFTRVARATPAPTPQHRTSTLSPGASANE